MQPEQALVHSNLGNALMAQGRMHEALACHRQAVAFGIDDTVIIVGMAIMAYAAIVVFAPSDNVKLTDEMILAALPLLFL